MVPAAAPQRPNETTLTTIHISAISYAHGEPRPIAELGNQAADLTKPEYGLADYRVGDREIWESAAAVGARTLALSESAGPPDLLLYVSENDGSPAASLEKIVRRLGLPRIAYLSVCGHGCGNLVPALRIAQDALSSGRHDRVLLVLADQALAHERLMLSGLSVLSDGAVSCLVTRDAPAAGGAFAIGPMATRSEVRPDTPDAEPILLSLIELAVASMADLSADPDARLKDIRYLLFGNYRVTTQKFLASAMGFQPDRLLLGHIAELGHCFSADALVSLEQIAAEGQFEFGDRILISAIGTHSWSMMIAEHAAQPGA